MMPWMKKREESDSELCLKCMECCKLLAIPLAYRADNKDMIKFFEARGHKIQTYNGIPYILLRETCKHLHPENGCDIYKDRPKWCKQYDGRFDPFVRDKCLWNKKRSNHVRTN